MADVVDEVDRAMVRLLETDARLSMRAIAAELSISRANAYMRFNRLVETGVIRGFTVDVDHAALGLQTSAYVEVSMEQNAWRSVRAALSKIDSVKYICLLSGAFDALVLIRTHDNHELRDVILDDLQSIDGITSTRTLLIFEEVRSQ
ncbi:MAG TPA: Lrp/AsnC family transcriptional regulator [Actinomycetes bacterium]|nr:Lrp/AsnC family transcriptional regulator [Actinomycetes bacterium]